MLVVIEKAVIMVGHPLMLDIHNNAVLFVLGKKIKPGGDFSDGRFERFLRFNMINVQVNVQKIFHKRPGTQKAFLNMTPYCSDSTFFMTIPLFILLISSFTFHPSKQLS